MDDYLEKVERLSRRAARAAAAADVFEILASIPNAPAWAATAKAKAEARLAELTAAQEALSPKPQTKRKGS